MFEGRVDIGVECVAQQRVFYGLRTVRSTDGNLALGYDLLRRSTFTFFQSPIPVRCPKFLSSLLPSRIVTCISTYYFECSLLKNLLS